VFGASFFEVFFGSEVYGVVLGLGLGLGLFWDMADAIAIAISCDM